MLNLMKPATVPAVAALRSRFSGPILGYVLSLLVLLASLLLVLMYWHGAVVREMQSAQADFTSESDAVIEQIERRLATHELILRGGVSLFASVERPSAEQWRSYVDALRVDERYPDMVGLGYTPYLSHSQLKILQLDLKEKGRGYYIIRPAGVREYYGPILYLEPRTPENIAAMGFDMFSDQVRQQAMAASRDDGNIHLTGRVQLVQDGAIQNSSMLMYAPVYRQSIVKPASIQDRRDAMVGWVYLPLRMDMLVEEALRSTQHDAALTIKDTTDSAAVSIYTAQPARTHDAKSARGPQDEKQFLRNATIEQYGREWELTFSANRQERMAASMSELRITLAIGILASLLVFAIALALARTESLAEAKAERMHDSFQRSELRFRNAMRFSAIGKALLDGDGRIVDANPALAKLLETTTEALVGKDFEGILMAEGAEANLRRKQMALNDGVFQSTRQVLLGDERVRHLQLTSALVPGEVGNDIANLVQVQDITERVQAQARERELNRTLESRVEQRTRELTLVNQELESFAYSISHDLRAPLRTIDGFSKILSDRYRAALDDAGQDYLSRVRQAASRMDELIGALLTMSRVSRGAMTMQLLDMTAMAEDVVAECQAMRPDRDVKVSIQPGMHAVGDAVLVRNLLENLVSNAWKFTGNTRDPTIQIGSDDSGTESLSIFHVTDNGAGFANEYAGKLFRPFQRLHRQDEFEGNGIGLASVKRVVERHGGWVTAEAEEGKGATFRFALPREQPAA